MVGGDIARTVDAFLEVGCPGAFGLGGSASAMVATVIR